MKLLVQRLSITFASPSFRSLSSKGSSVSHPEKSGLRQDKISGGATPPSRAAQITNDPGKIDAAIAAFDEVLVDRGGASPKRRRRVARARGGLREFQILKHHGSGEARLEIAVCGRGRHQTRHWTIARHGPALPRRFRGNLKQPLRIQPELFRE